MTDRTPTDDPAQVDAYLAAAPSPQRETLTALRAMLRSLLPHATEGLRYGMPTMIVDGKGVAGFGSFAKHCGYFPMSGTVMGAAGEVVAGYEVSKGGLKFAVDTPLPEPVVRRLVELRLAELSLAP